MSEHQQHVGRRDPRISDEAIERGRRAHELDRAHVFHSWSAQRDLTPMTILDAEGSWVWDGEGRPMVDFSGQLVFTNVGHRHPKIVAAIREQAETLATVAPQHVNDARSEAARLITERLPESINHVFFTNAGAEANEHAVRMARLHTGRHKVLSAYLSYHGATRLTANLTGSLRRVGSDSASDGVVHFQPAYTYRSAFGSESDEQEAERALAHLRDVIELEGPSTVAAVILEAVPGTAGIFLPPPGYMAGVKELCREHGILLIIDEVMVGFGRVGEWFGHQLTGVTPDIVTFAKGVNSGYVPLGGVAMSDDVYESFATTPYPGGLTYSGHPLACAAAVAAITAMEEEGMVAHAKRIGDQIIGPRLAEIAAAHPSVGDVRGAGAFWAVELVKDRQTRERLAPLGQVAPVMGRMMAEAKDRGLLLFMAENRFHLCPPLNISDEDLRFGLDVLDQVLALAASAEADSEHPLAKAIVTAAKDKGLALQQASGFSSSPAVGVTATVSGQKVRVGGPRLLEETGQHEVGTAEAWRSEGAIILHVLRGGQVVGGLRLADEVRPESRDAVDALHALGVEVVMITGDAEAVANEVGRELGIDRVFAGVRPEDKSAKVSQLQEEGKRVAMVGDGVNDAPALAQADVGIAIGAGTDVAIASAGVILASSDPRSVLSIIQLSRRAYGKMKQNLWWAAGYNLLSVPLAAGILAPVGLVLPMSIGAILMSASTVVVALNAQLLRRIDLTPEASTRSVLERQK